MSPGKDAGKEWKEFSRVIKLPDSDWQVIEVLYREQCTLEGRQIPRPDFVRQLVLQGAGSLMMKLKQNSPETLHRVGQSIESLNKYRI